MSDSPAPTNSLANAAASPPGRAGDLPDRIRQRYLAERRFDGAVAYFTDAVVITPSFRDTGRRLIAARSDPATIRDLVAIARHRGWTSVEVRGSDSFRREVWMSGRGLGLEVRGYRPTERDHQALERRAAQTLPAATAERATAASPSRLDLRTSQDRLRVVESVVRHRVADAGDQSRMLEALRARTAAEAQPDRDRGRGLVRDRPTR